MELAVISSAFSRQFLLAGIRQQPTNEEVEMALETEQQVIGTGMAMLAGLHLEEENKPSSEIKRQTGIFGYRIGNQLCGVSGNAQVLSWDRLQEASSGDETTKNLIKMIRSGVLEDRNQWTGELGGYYRYREHLSVIDSVVLYQSRPMIPISLRREVLEILHSAHQGVSGMTARAAISVFWPGMTEDIIRTRLACSFCDRSSPSQPAAPPTKPATPAFPFEMMCSDYLSYAGKEFLIMVDRYSGWLSVYESTPGGGANALIQCLKTHFTTFGIPAELATDGGPTYRAGLTEKFLQDWGVHHRVSSAYFPHSNQRAEGGVKTAKRMLMENLSPAGKLNTDRFFRALLCHRTTPDRDTGLSPAQVVFGRVIRDFLPVLPQQYKPRPEWTLSMEQRELALARRHAKQGAVLSEHTKALKPLKVGDTVLIQNQTGPKPNKWDKTGMVVEKMMNDQYRIKTDGSGRVTLRNRRFLRPFTPYTPHVLPLADQVQQFYPEEIPQTVGLHDQEQAPAEQVVPHQERQEVPHQAQPGVCHQAQPVQQEQPEVPRPAQPDQQGQPGAPHQIQPDPMINADRMNPPMARKSSRSKKKNSKYDDYILGKITLLRT